MTPAEAWGGCLAFFSACTRASTFSCSAISDRSRSSAVSRLFRAAICRRMSSPLAIVSCPSWWKLPAAAGQSFGQERRPDSTRSRQKVKIGSQTSESSRLPVALASKHAEPYRLSSPRPPQCGALWATARLLTFSRGLLRRPLLRGPRVRIRLPPAVRWYGAGGEEMAPSSLANN